MQGGGHQLSVHPLVDDTDTDIANPDDARFGLQRELQIFQCGHTCILTEGDWTLTDTKWPLAYTITSPKIEAFTIMLPRPSDATIAALCERGVARRLTGRWGLSRVLHAMVNESFGEIRRLPPSSGKKLGAAITTMAWDALREQIETPPVIEAHE